jgi:hypothetical protein
LAHAGGRVKFSRGGFRSLLGRGNAATLLTSGRVVHLSNCCKQSPPEGG